MQGYLRGIKGQAGSTWEYMEIKENIGEYRIITKWMDRHVDLIKIT
jgi:hypothetical protein